MAANVVTMVFTDLIDSTAMKPRLPGDDSSERNRAYFDTILTPHRQRIEAELERYGGRVVKTEGDAYFLVFANAAKAVRWAVAVQVSHATDPINTPLGHLQLKVGMHTGSPMPDPNSPDDFVGNEVDYAARIAALARGGQILLSRATAALVMDAQVADVAFRSIGEHHLKGIGRVNVTELVYQGGAAAPTEGTKWALLVGINDYERADIAPLAFAVNDVRALAETLSTVVGFPRDQVFTLTSDDPSHKPTRGNIADRFDSLARRVQPNDTFFFFFAGHGIARDESNYLLTYEANPRSALTLQESCLPAERVQSWLNALPAAVMLSFYDTCRNDPVAARGDDDNVLDDTLVRDLRVVPRAASVDVSATVYACKVGQRSYEWVEKKQGFFTYFLIEGLKGAAAEGGVVTLNSLESYLAREVPRKTLEIRNARQEPWVVREGIGTVKLAQLAPRNAPVPIATTAVLTVTSKPEGATVLIDSTPAGTTPLTKTMDLDVRQELDIEVVLCKEGYQSEAAIIRLARGRASDWRDVVLTPAAILAITPPQPGIGASGDAVAESSCAETASTTVLPHRPGRQFPPGGWKRAVSWSALLAVTIIILVVFAMMQTTRNSRVGPGGSHVTTKPPGPPKPIVVKPGKVCPQCRKIFRLSDTYCDKDTTSLVRAAKVCPECKRQFGSSEIFCDKDTSMLVEIKSLAETR